MQNKKIFLVDLDGTLLNAHRFFFAANVFFILKAFFPILGFRTFKILVPAIKDLLNNRNTKSTNFEVLKDSLQRKSGLNLEKPLQQFYETDFPKLAKLCKPVPGAAKALKRLKDSGCTLYLTTNPIWPASCVHLRLQWAKVDASLFDGITHSENWHACKPTLQYYQEILQTWGLNATDCVLIGDNPKKEGPAAQLGIEVIIVSPKSSLRFWQSLV